MQPFADFLKTFNQRARNIEKARGQSPDTVVGGDPVMTTKESLITEKEIPKLKDTKPKVNTPNVMPELTLYQPPVDEDFSYDFQGDIDSPNANIPPETETKPLIQWDKDTVPLSERFDRKIPLEDVDDLIAMGAIGFWKDIVGGMDVYSKEELQERLKNIAEDASRNMDTSDMPSNFWELGSLTKKGVRGILSMLGPAGDTDRLQENVEAFKANLSKETQDALERNFVTQDAEGNYHVGNADINTLLAMVAVQSPNIIATLGSAYIGGALLTRLAGIPAALTPKALASVRKTGYFTSAIGTQYTATALSTSSQVYESLSEQPAHLWQESPLYNRVMDKLLNHPEHGVPTEDYDKLHDYAVESVSRQLAYEAGIVSGDISALAMTPFAGWLGKIMSGKKVQYNKAFFNKIGAVKEGLKGTGLEMVAEGMQEGFAETMTRNYYLREGGQPVNIWHNVINDTITGSLVSGPTALTMTTAVAITAPIQIDKINKEITKGLEGEGLFDVGSTLDETGLSYVINQDINISEADNKTLQDFIDNANEVLAREPIAEQDADGSDDPNIIATANQYSFVRQRRDEAVIEHARRTDERVNKIEEESTQSALLDQPVVLDPIIVEAEDPSKFKVEEDEDGKFYINNPVTKERMEKQYNNLNSAQQDANELNNLNQRPDDLETPFTVSFQNPETRQRIVDTAKKYKYRQGSGSKQRREAFEEDLQVGENWVPKADDDKDIVKSVYLMSHYIHQRQKSEKKRDKKVSDEMHSLLNEVGYTDEQIAFMANEAKQAIINNKKIKFYDVNPNLTKEPYEFTWRGIEDPSGEPVISTDSPRIIDTPQKKSIFNRFKKLWKRLDDKRASVKLTTAERIRELLSEGVGIKFKPGFKTRLDPTNPRKWKIKNLSDVQELIHLFGSALSGYHKSLHTAYYRAVKAEKIKGLHLDQAILGENIGEFKTENEKINAIWGEFLNQYIYDSQTTAKNYPALYKEFVAFLNKKPTVATWVFQMHSAGQKWYHASELTKGLSLMVGGLGKQEEVDRKITEVNTVTTMDKIINNAFDAGHSLGLARTWMTNDGKKFKLHAHEDPQLAYQLMSGEGSSISYGLSGNFVTPFDMRMRLSLDKLASQMGVTTTNYSSKKGAERLERFYNTILKDSDGKDITRRKSKMIDKLDDEGNVVKDDDGNVIQKVEWEWIPVKAGDFRSLKWILLPIENLNGRKSILGKELGGGRYTVSDANKDSINKDITYSTMFSAYALAKRAKTLKTRDKENLFTDEQIKAIIDEVEKHMKKNDVDAYNVFVKAHRELVGFGEMLADYAVDAGLISPEVRERFRIETDYVPYIRKRDMDTGETLHSYKTGRLDFWQPKAMKGGTHRIIDPIESLMRNYSTIVRSANRNDVMVKLYDMYQYMSAKDFPEKGATDPVNESDNPITFHDEPQNKEAIFLSRNEIIRELDKDNISVIDATLSNKNMQAIEKKLSELEWDVGIGEVLEYNMIDIDENGRLRHSIASENTQNKFVIYKPNENYQNIKEEYSDNKVKTIHDGRMALQSFFKPSIDSRTTYVFYKNGERKFLEIQDTEEGRILQDTLDLLQPKVVRFVNNWMGEQAVDNLKRSYQLFGKLPAKIQREMIVLSPDFIIRNFMRDTIVSGFQSSARSKPWPIVSAMRGLKIFMFDKEARNIMNSFGGSFASQWENPFVWSQPKDVKDLQKLISPRIMQDKVLSPVAFLRMLADFGKMTESLSRIREFKVVKEELMEGGNLARLGDNASLLDKIKFKIWSPVPPEYSQFMQTDEDGVAFSMNEIDATLLAAKAAREVSVDFGKGGSNSFIRGLASTIPFMNARMQGWLQAGKTLKRNPALFMTQLSMYALASVSAYAFTKEEGKLDDRKEWELDMYHFISASIPKVAREMMSKLFPWIYDEKDADVKYFKIPRAFEWGAMTRIIEGFYDWFQKDLKPAEAKALSHLIVRTIGDTFSHSGASGLTPALYQAISNYNSNIDTFLDRPIDPTKSQAKPMEDRAHSTTPLSIRALAKMSGMPAAKLAYLNHTFFSSFGQLLALTADKMLYDKEYPDKHFTSYPIFKSIFWSKDVNLNSSVDKSYKTFLHIARVRETVKSLFDAQISGDKDLEKSVNPRRPESYHREHLEYLYEDDPSFSPYLSYLAQNNGYRFNTRIDRAYQETRKFFNDKKEERKLIQTMDKPTEYLQTLIEESYSQQNEKAEEFIKVVEKELSTVKDYEETAYKTDPFVKPLIEGDMAAKVVESILTKPRQISNLMKSALGNMIRDATNEENQP